MVRRRKVDSTRNFGSITLLCFLLLHFDLSNGQVKTLNSNDLYVTNEFEQLTQVVRTAATILNFAQDELTPQSLTSLVYSVVSQNRYIYGSAVAFEPDYWAYKLGPNGTASAAFNISLGASNSDGTPRTQLQPSDLLLNRTSYLYCPYAYRGGDWKPGWKYKAFDLADGYDYTAPETEWYIAPRNLFHEGKLVAGQGYWTAPYFDTGAGNIEMITYCLPFFKRPTNIDRALPWTQDAAIVDDDEHLDFGGILTFDLSLADIDHGQQVQLSSNTKVIMMLVTFIALAADTGMIIVAIVYRHHAVIKASSPIFCVLITLGCALGHVASLMFALQPLTNTICIMQPAFGHMAFAVCFGSLFAKTYRLHRVFNQDRIRRVRIRTWVLCIFFVGGLMLVMGVLLVVWMALDPPVPKTTFNKATRQFSTFCVSGNSIYSTLAYIAEGAVLAFGVYLTCRVRNLPTRFNESRHIALALYNMVLLASLSLPLVSSEGVLTPLVVYQFEFMVIFLISSCTLLLLFVPKVLVLYGVKRCVNDDFTHTTTASSAGGGGSYDSDGVYRVNDASRSHGSHGTQGSRPTHYYRYHHRHGHGYGGNTHASYMKSVYHSRMDPRSHNGDHGDPRFPPTTYSRNGGGYPSGNMMYPGYVPQQGPNGPVPGLISPMNANYNNGMSQQYQYANSQGGSITGPMSMPPSAVSPRSGSNGSGSGSQQRLNDAMFTPTGNPMYPPNRVPSMSGNQGGNNSDGSRSNSHSNSNGSARVSGNQMPVNMSGAPEPLMTSARSVGGSQSDGEMPHHRSSSSDHHRANSGGSAADTPVVGVASRTITSGRRSREGSDEQKAYGPGISTPVNATDLQLTQPLRGDDARQATSSPSGGSQHSNTPTGPPPQSHTQGTTTGQGGQVSIEIQPLSINSQNNTSAPAS